MDFLAKLLEFKKLSKDDKPIKLFFRKGDGWVALCNLLLMARRGEVLLEDGESEDYRLSEIFRQGEWKGSDPSTVIKIGQNFDERFFTTYILPQIERFEVVTK